MKENFSNCSSYEWCDNFSFHYNINRWLIHWNKLTFVCTRIEIAWKGVIFYLLYKSKWETRKPAWNFGYNKFSTSFILSIKSYSLFDLFRNYTVRYLWHLSIFWNKCLCPLESCLMNFQIGWLRARHRLTTTTLLRCICIFAVNLAFSFSIKIAYALSLSPFSLRISTKLEIFLTTLKDDVISMHTCTYQILSRVGQKFAHEPTFTNI